MSAVPARLAGLSAQKGAFTAGADADIVVFDPDTEWTVSEDQLHFRHKLSPYMGAHVRGQVLETWLRGAQVYSRCEPLTGDDCFLGKPRGWELVRS
jgi:allantoinase